MFNDNKMSFTGMTKEDAAIYQRRISNENILRLLDIAVKHMPELRFHQILWALNVTEREGENIKDKFYEESITTLKRLEQSLNEMK